MQKKRILVISDLPLLPADAGNKARVWALMKNLRAAGHDVWFLGLGLSSEDEARLRLGWGNKMHVLPHRRLRQTKPLAGALRQWAFGKLVERGWVSPSVDDWFRPHWDEGIQAFAAREKFDVVLVEYVFFSQALRHFDGAFRIIDTHDVFTGRREKLRSRKIKKLYRYLTDEQEEARGLRRADAIIAIQQTEAGYSRRILRDERPVVTVGHTVATEILPPLPSGTANILFLASDNVLNLDALRQFLEQSFPKVQAAVPNPRLLVAGTICRKLSGNLPGVELLGEVAELRDAYALASVVINPMMVGTGLKTKSVEALGYGKPLVTSPCGAEGLEAGAGRAFVMASNAAEFATAIISLLKDARLAADLGRRAYAFAEAWNSRQLESLHNLISEVPAHV